MRKAIRLLAMAVSLSIGISGISSFPVCATDEFEENNSNSAVSTAGIRLSRPISAIVGESYHQKILNIYDKAGDSHELHYTCDWRAGEEKEGELYSSVETLENELPANLTLSNDGVLSGIPDKPGSIYLWVDISWSNSSNTFSMMPSSIYDNKYAYAISLTIYDKNNNSENGYKKIGNDPEQIVVDKDFVLPANKEMWYEFTSPRGVIGYSSCTQYMSKRKIGQSETVLDGIYDANGYPRPPELMASTVLVSAGEKYYLYLNNTTDQDATLRIDSFGDGLTIDKYLKNQQSEDVANYGKAEILEKGVTKNFTGDSNQKWDIYDLTFTWDVDFEILPERYLMFWDSYAVVAPYMVHFEEEGYDFALSGDEYRKTASITTSTLAGTINKISIPAGTSKMGQSNVMHLCSDGALNGTVSFSCKIYVPTGKTLTEKDGMFWDSEYAESDYNPEENNTSAPEENNTSTPEENNTSTPLNISNASTSGIKKSYTYTGKALTPPLQITYSGQELSKGKDYSLTFSSNKNVGTAKILISGVGDYTGSKTITFKITKATNPLKIKISSKTYKQKKLTKNTSFSIGASKGKGKVSYSLSSSGKKAKIKVSSKGKVTIPKKCKKGSYKITVAAKGDANYKAISKTVKISIK